MLCWNPEFCMNRITKYIWDYSKITQRKSFEQHHTVTITFPQIRTRLHMVMLKSAKNISKIKSLWLWEKIVMISYGKIYWQKNLRTSSKNMGVLLRRIHQHFFRNYLLILTKQHNKFSETWENRKLNNESKAIKSDMNFRISRSLIYQQKIWNQ